MKRLAALASLAALLISLTAVQPAQAAISPAVAVAMSPATAGAGTRLVYAATITRSGYLTSVEMSFPPGTHGIGRVSSGTLRGAGSYRMVWTPAHRVYWHAGSRLRVTVDGFSLPTRAGTYPLTFTAWAGRTALTRGQAPVTVRAKRAAGVTVASPNPVPRAVRLAPAPLPAVPAGCPKSYPSTVVENARPGATDWTIGTGPQASPYTSDITGAVSLYTTQTSAACGESVGLKISSAMPVTLTAYRIGYYGGLGARKVWTSPDPVATSLQAGATTDPTTQQVSTTWPVSAQVAITGDFVPGVYLLEASDGVNAAYAPLTVRDDTRRHDVLIQQATATWQAYNSFGGHNFYNGSNTLSYDRPYVEGQGSGQFLSLEQGFIFWAERHGIDAAYWTDEDLHRYGAQVPERAGTLILPAHDEYYSEGMRQALSSAVLNGVNVLNLGANTVYRRIVYSPDLRTFTLDRAKSSFRAWGSAWDEQSILGAQYYCSGASGSLTAGTSWLWAGIPEGTQISGLVNGENDLVWSRAPSPAGVAVLATGTGTCHWGETTRADVVAHVAPSGAHVFNGSTFAFSCFLVARCPSNWHSTDGGPLEISAQDQAEVSQMITNLMAWAGVSLHDVAPPPLRMRAAVRPPVIPQLPLADESGAADD